MGTSDRQHLLRYATQSEVRVSSGVRLVAVLVGLSLGSVALGIWWLAKTFAVVAAFFILATAAEYRNARRRHRQAQSLHGQNVT
jgi:Flp pilus assembly protein TadB